MAPSRTLTRGPAGCGKTRAALFECEAFLAEHGHALRDDQRVLILSCTASAVARIHESIPQLLPRPDHRRRLAINTFAGFKWELLGRFGRHLGLGRKLTLVSPVARLDGSPANQGEIVFAEFDRNILRLLTGSPSLTAAYRSRFPMVVIDELQDTSDSDWELVQVLAESAVLRCYGDPMQAVGITTLETAHARMEAAVAFGCVPYDMAGGSHRDQSQGQAITALAEAIRDNGDIRAAGVGARAARALAVRRYKYPSTLPIEVKAVVQGTRKRHPDWQIGVLTLMKFNLDGLSRGLLSPTAAAPYSVTHRVVGRQDVCLATDPFLLAAWSRTCNHEVPDATLVRLCGLAVASVLRPDRLEGLAKELVDGATSGEVHKGKARALLASLVPSANSPDPKQWERVADAVKALDRKRFENFALGRIDVLRRRAEKLLAQRDCSIDELIADGRNLSAEEAGIRKSAPPARVQLMTIDTCKGREFDLVVLVNSPNEPFLRQDDAPLYEAARAKLYTAVTRARRAVAVVLPENDACGLLDPLA